MARKYGGPIRADCCRNPGLPGRTEP
jgi:hypothetical protein